jgi:hypothetical protein
MEHLEEQVTYAVSVAIVAAYGAALERGAPGTPEFLTEAAAMLARARDRVWTLPADPDEWMRHTEAETYQLLLDVPVLLEAVMMRIAEGEADV